MKSKRSFLKENAQDKIARTLAKEANVKLAVLNPLEGLTNSQIEKGENYLTVMRQNLQALVIAGSKQTIHETRKYAVKTKNCL